MSDADVVELVGTTSVGRKYPQRLGIVVTIHGSAAHCAFFGANLAEHAVPELFSYDIVWIHVGRYGTTIAVCNVAADLYRGQRVEIIAFSGGGRRRLRFDHAHEAGDSPEISVDAYGLSRRNQFVELNGNAGVSSTRCGHNFRDVADDFAARAYGHAGWQRNVLHDSCRDLLAGFAVGG